MKNAITSEEQSGGRHSAQRKDGRSLAEISEKLRASGSSSGLLDSILGLVIASVLLAFLMFWMDEESGIITDVLKTRIDVPGVLVIRIIYVLLMSFSAIMTLSYCGLLVCVVVARFGTLRKQRHAGPLRLELVQEVGLDIGTLVVPVLAAILLECFTPRFLERVLFRLTGQSGIDPPVWQVSMVLIAAAFGLRMVGKIGRSGASTLLYEVRFGRMLRKRALEARRYADTHGMAYKERAAECYPVEWVPVGRRQCSPRMRANWVMLEQDLKADPVYDLWRTAWQRGYGGYAFNILTFQVQDRPLHLFDYHEAKDGFVCGQGRWWAFIMEFGQRDYTIATLELPRKLPALFICPEGSGDKVERFFGATDIDMESIEISEAYRIWSGDRRFAYDVFHPRMMELLSEHPGVAMRISCALLSLRFPRLVRVEEFREITAMLERVYEFLPSFVLSEVGPKTRNSITPEEG